MTVALGDDINMFELQYVTSNPDAGNLFFASDYSNIQKLESAVRENMFAVCTGRSRWL